MNGACVEILIICWVGIPHVYMPTDKGICASEQKTQRRRLH